LNPGFDGTVTPTIRNGVVTGLQFVTDEVDDISPVRALKGLRELDGGGSLRSLTGLERINDKPAADFWKEVDGK
jgi:hypothetical protein